ncbi:HNH endonuclease family protein [Streptomyces sp. NPDC007157]|uniref:HNH endonuclease family protein n=1 Tax=Streptomyces sp. NPDC007157 TaxID=3154681 RepID=UPI0033F4419D
MDWSVGAITNHANRLGLSFGREATRATADARQVDLTARRQRIQERLLHARRGPPGRSRHRPEIGAKCALTGGSWYSPYDDHYLDSASQLDVDHLVPLAEAWDSGASAWTPKEREAYANDLDDPRALIAVSAASNRSKADKDPTEWLPPYAGYWYTYVTDWVADKTRYQPSIDPAEQTALTEQLAACPDLPITVTLAH